jgi:hypothetical protein
MVALSSRTIPRDTVSLLSSSCTYKDLESTAVYVTSAKYVICHFHETSKIIIFTLVFLIDCSKKSGHIENNNRDYIALNMKVIYQC